MMLIDLLRSLFPSSPCLRRATQWSSDAKRRHPALQRAARAAMVVTIACWSTACGRADAQQPAPAQEAGAVSVRVVPAMPAAVQAWLYGQGTARAHRREFLSFANQGRVTYVDPKLRVGSRVKKGQLIAYQEPDRVRADLASARAGLAGAQAELAAARAALSEAEANLELARVTHERYLVLIAQNSASRQELDQARAQLEQARAAYRRAEVQIKSSEAQVNASRSQVAQAQVIVSESRLVSPIDGVLARLNIEQGRYFTPQVVQTGTEQGALRTVPAVVIDPSAFEITVDLPAYAFRQIEEGAAVVIGHARAQAPPTIGGSAGGPQAAQAQQAAPAPEGELQGRVHAVSPSLDPETRTFQVIIRTTTETPRLQDGEFVNVWIAGQARDQVLAVPLEALRYQAGQAFLFVVDPQSGIARERRVALGQIEGNRQAVLSGLSEGELVVTEGRARLNDGQ
ncbi:MAG TPA: efflux RND transporter periplasmic adaptor subunit, partial [Noviherbaspirillum sp.]|nr:efflux RND transporter periplasmic adaptor subunit [Noviherbaspirillum sp.]